MMLNCHFLDISGVDSRLDLTNSIAYSKMVPLLVLLVFLEYVVLAADLITICSLHALNLPIQEARLSC